uniref:Uncharacterized protein n=1 Tax=Rhizophora mucronata TaxID=61149 RepID=A0A2P2QWK9_RHIMU
MKNAYLRAQFHLCGMLHCFISLKHKENWIME